MSVFKNYIAGQWLDSDKQIANINPSDIDDTIGFYASASESQFNLAIDSAQQAFDDWQYSGSQQRFDILDFIGTEILSRQNELGELLAREEGKVRSEGIAEVARAGQIFKFFAGEALRSDGQCLPSVRPGVKAEVTREPVGTIGVITPWNFPIAIPAWKIAPALCYGNCVLFKPSELVPASAWALTEIISRSGLPSGVFNLLVGEASVVGESILCHEQVDAVTFTGSVETGNHVLKTLTARGAKAQMEMGGKNPLVILDDANLEQAVECAIQGAFYSTGQRCTASSRLIVTEGIADAFTTAMIERVSQLKVGHALDSSSQIGPLANEMQLKKTERYIQLGKVQGAQLLAGGYRLSRDTPGYYLHPALFTETTPDMSINRDEIFGPVASIIKVKDYGAALEIANDTAFGLSAGICTQSGKMAEDFKRKAQAGMIMVNLPTAGVDYHVPFGGRKRSSYGSREQGHYAREFYTTVKTAYQIF